MEPYQERVVEERMELGKKLGRLKGFLASDPGIGVATQRLLRQESVMVTYLGILDERIASF